MATGKISMDELSLELQEIIKNGSVNSKIIANNFIINDIDGIFHEFGLPEQFPLIDLLKILPGYMSKMKNLDSYLENTVINEAKKEIALLNEEIKRLQEQVGKIKGGTVTPPPPAGNEDYTVDSSKYKVEVGYGNVINISLTEGGTDTLVIPSDPFVTPERLVTGVKKVKSLVQYIQQNNTLMQTLNGYNTVIKKYVKEGE